MRITNITSSVTDNGQSVVFRFIRAMVIHDSQVLILMILIVDNYDPSLLITPQDLEVLFYGAVGLPKQLSNDKFYPGSDVTLQTKTSSLTSGVLALAAFGSSFATISSCAGVSVMTSLTDK